MPEFNRAVLPSLISVGPKRVEASPFQFALSGDEQLRIACINSLANVKVIVQGKFYTESGQYSWLRFDVTPTSDRVLHYADFAQEKSILTNLVAFVEGASPSIGQTFVQVKLVVGKNTTPFVIGTLIQGYVTSTQELAWPGSGVTSSLDGGGYLRFIIGTDRGAGWEVLETVPAGARWELISMRCFFLASATIATRKSRLIITGSGGAMITVLNPASVTASGFTTWQWAQGLAPAPTTDTLYPIAGLPSSCPMLAGATITTDTENMAAGDHYTNPQYAVREWLEAQ